MIRQTWARAVACCFIVASATYAIYWTTARQTGGGLPSAGERTSAPVPSTSVHTAATLTGGARRRAEEATPVARTGQDGGVTTGNSGGQVVFTNGKLTVHAEDVPLRALLADIGTQSGIAIRSFENIDSLSISGEVVGAPLAEGLLQLLRGFDVFLFFAGREASAPVLKTVWLYPKRQGETLAPLPLATNESGQTVHDLAKHGTAVESATWEELQPHDQARVMAELTQALQSPQAEARYRALAASLERQIELPVHALQQMASADTSREVRALALAALSQSREADAALVRASAQMALRDSDLEIQAQAKGLLEYLDLAGRSNEDVSPPSQE